MLSGQITQTDLLRIKFIAPVGNVGLAGKILAGHGGLALAGGAGGVAEEGVVWASGAAAFTALEGHSVCGKVARFVAAGSVGKYSGPC